MLRAVLVVLSGWRATVLADDRCVGGWQTGDGWGGPDAYETYVGTYTSREDCIDAVKSLNDGASSATYCLSAYSGSSRWWYPGDCVAEYFQTGKSSTSRWENCLFASDTETPASSTISGRMVSGLSAERGWCLDSVTFHYADGGTTKFGESGGGPVPRVDLDPTAEYVSGVLQYGATVGCSQYMEGGIKFIVKSISTGANLRTVSFAGSYQSSTVLREYNVEWPCRIIGLEFDYRYIDGVLRIWGG